MLLIGWTLGHQHFRTIPPKSILSLFFFFFSDRSSSLACEAVRLSSPSDRFHNKASSSTFFFKSPPPCFGSALRLLFFSTFLNSLETGLRRVHGPLQRRWGVYVTLGWTGCDFFFFFFDVWQFRRGLPGGIPPVRLVWLLNHFKEESLPLNYRFN